jgi:hypothetical protein
MPKYVIERTIPGAGKSSPAQLSAIAKQSCDVIEKLGPQIQWMHSYVTGDKVYCVYYAADPDLITEHARLSGFPADSITEVKAVIDPATAEGAGAQAAM